MARYSRVKLIALAKQLVDAAGGQVPAAQVLGISQSAISQALRADPDKATFDKILTRIVEGLGDRTVESTTVFEVRKKA